MRELKVQCDCGQKFKFDVEPVNNQMPWTVNCPICGRDGTEKANLLLRAQAGVSAAPVVSTLPPAPAPMDPAIRAAASPAVEQPKLRISPSAHAESAPAAPAAPIPQRIIPLPPTGVVKAKTEKEFNLPLGVVGAVVGGFLGMMGWYFLIKATHYEIGYAAWGVGVLAGLGARILGRGGDTILGIFAAACALVAILGGQYLFISDLFKSEFNNGISEVMEGKGDFAYDAQMEIAKEAAKANTDDEFKAVYVQRHFAQPTEAELKEFKEKEIPALKMVASGQITKDQLLKDLKEKAVASMRSLSWNLRWELFKGTLTGMTLLFLLLGVSSAYKIGAG